jgi:hypothetical protein
MVILWAVVLFLTSVVLPPIEQTIALVLRILPPEVELIRSIRYFYLFGFTFAVWGVAELTRNITLPSGRLFLRICAFAAALSWVVLHWIYIGDAPAFDAADFPRLGVLCLSRGDLTCASGADAVQFAEAVKAITPSGSTILPSDGQRNELRYFALRPLVYAEKDGVYLAYTNHDELMTWRDHRDRLEAINEIGDRQQRLEELITFAEELNADYLATNFRIDFELVPSTVNIVFANDSGMLIEIHPGASSNPPNPPLF